MLDSYETKFRVEARCTVLMRAKVAVVTARDKDHAVEKAREQFKENVTITKVEEYDGETNDG